MPCLLRCIAPCMLAFSLSDRLVAQLELQPVPTYTFKLSESSVSVKMPSPMLEGVVGCSTDGDFVVNSIMDANDVKKTNNNVVEVVNVISPDGSAQNYDLSRITDLDHDIGFRAFDVSEREVVFLIYTSERLNASDKRFFSPAAWHVARFDRQGVYRGQKELELLKFSPEKLAEFPNGDLLLFGVDEVSHKPRLARYALTGDKFSYLDSLASFAINNPTLPSSFAKDYKPDEPQVARAKLDAAVQFSQVVHMKDSILLLQMNAGAPIFQVFQSGFIQTIRPPKISGYTTDSIVASDGPLYLRYRREGTNTGRGDDGFILEVEAQMSQPLRRFSFEDFSMWDVVCARRGRFSVVKLKGESTFDFVDASAVSGSH